MARVRQAYGFGDPSEEARQYWEAHIKGQDALRQQAKPQQGHQNPAMQAPAFAPPGASVRQQGNTTIYDRPAPQAPMPQGNPLLQALSNYQAPTMRQAEQATFQMLPPAYGFQQEMIQAPMIAKQRERAMEMFNQGQRQALGTGELTSRNQLGQGELMLKQQLGLGELGLKGGELELKQQEMGKRFDPMNIALAGLAQSGKMDLAGVEGIRRALQGLGSPTGGGIGGPGGAPPGAPGGAPAPGSPHVSPIERLTMVNPNVAQAFQAGENPSNKAMTLYRQMGPQWMQENWQLVQELIGTQDLKDLAHPGWLSRTVTGIPYTLGALNPFATANLYSPEGRAQLGAAHNTPLFEMFNKKISEPTEQDQLNALIRAKYAR